MKFFSVPPPPGGLSVRLHSWPLGRADPPERRRHPSALQRQPQLVVRMSGQWAAGLLPSDVCCRWECVHNTCTTHVLIMSVSMLCKAPKQHHWHRTINAQHKAVAWWCSCGWLHVHAPPAGEFNADMEALETPLATGSDGPGGERSTPTKVRGGRVRVLMLWFYSHCMLCSQYRDPLLSPSPTVAYPYWSVCIMLSYLCFFIST